MYTVLTLPIMNFTMSWTFGYLVRSRLINVRQNKINNTYNYYNIKQINIICMSSMTNVNATLGFSSCFPPPSLDDSISIHFGSTNRKIKTFQTIENMQLEWPGGTGQNQSSMLR